MKQLVAYECPTHGWLLDAVPGAKVDCGQCRKLRPGHEIRNSLTSTSSEAKRPISTSKKI